MYWIREVVGWILIVLGLIVFGTVYFVFLRNGLIFESGPMTFMGFIIFRGGIHLVKVAVAARICQDVTEEAARSRHRDNLVPSRRFNVPGMPTEKS